MNEVPRVNDVCNDATGENAEAKTIGQYVTTVKMVIIILFYSLRYNHGVFNRGVIASSIDA